MNSEYNDMRQSREIDLIDLFWYWLSHYKSLIVFLVIGIGVGLFLFFTAPKADTVNVDDSSTNVSSEVKEGSNMTKSSYASAAFEKPFPYKEGVDWNKRLSDSQRTYVDEVVNIYRSVNELSDSYNNSSALSLEDKSESLYYITSAKTNLDTMITKMSEDERKFFYEQIGQNTISDYYGDTVVINGTKSNTTKTSASKTSGGKTKLLISVLVAFILHVLLFALIYIFDKKVKYTDNPAAMLNTFEFSRVIDWNAINSKDPIVRAITRARLKGERKIEYDEALQVDANSIIDIATKNNLSELLIISQNLTSEGEDLKKLLEEDSNIKVSVVDSVTHSATGAKTASATGGCVILGKVDKTILYDIFEEGAAVRSREIDLLGVIVYV